MCGLQVEFNAFDGDFKRKRDVPRSLRGLTGVLSQGEVQPPMPRSHSPKVCLGQQDGQSGAGMQVGCNGIQGSHGPNQMLHVEPSFKAPSQAKLRVSTVTWNRPKSASRQEIAARTSRNRQAKLE